MLGTRRPIISLLTDYGLRDPSAGICKGVMLRICPDALLIDISHEVDKFAIRDGALLLWCALPYLPVGVHMAVVDPGVGTARRAIALTAGRGDVLIGPDNGLLMPALERLGGLARAHLIEAAKYRLEPVSPSFHGRDIFAPAAAHVAAGLPVERLGPAVAPDSLVRLPLPTARVREGALETAVLYIDTFGNGKLAGLRDDLEAAVGRLAQDRPLAVEFTGRGGRAAQRRATILWSETFGDVPAGEPLLCEDSYGRLSLAVNQGSAAARFHLGEDQPLLIRAA